VRGADYHDSCSSHYEERRDCDEEHQRFVYLKKLEKDGMRR
jgi:hypothetical protein